MPASADGLLGSGFFDYHPKSRVAGRRTRDPQISATHVKSIRNNERGEYCMPARITALGFAALLASTALGALPTHAETFVEHSSEVRMQLDFVVPAAALAKFVPAGFDMNVATQGPAKDCNVRMIFIDRVDITKA